MDLKHEVEMKRSLALGAMFVAMAVLLIGAVSVSEMRSSIDSEADATLHQFYTQSEVHRGLLSKAVAALVILRMSPSDDDASGSYAEGELLLHGIPVAYYRVTYRGTGDARINAQPRGVILFMTDQALDQFQKNDEWTIGSDGQVTVASTHAGKQYDAATLKNPILAFVFDDNGPIAGLSLDGTTIGKMPA